MKIIVLGGAGDMASRAVRELAAEPDLTALTIADYNAQSAEQLASALGDKVSARSDCAGSVHRGRSLPGRTGTAKRSRPGHDWPMAGGHSPEDTPNAYGTGIAWAGHLHPAQMAAAAPATCRL